jgi:exosortase H (IPTLxxWG-CTERM-specific)
MWLRMTLFVVLVLAGNPFVKPDAEGRNVFQFMSEFISEGIERMLLFLGEGVYRHGNVIMDSSGASAIKISDECLGADAMLILFSAIIVYPSRIKDQFLGLLVGLTLFQAVNIARIISLYYVNKFHHEYFELLHDYVWQGVVILIVAGYYWLWLRCCGRGSVRV